MTFPVYIPFQYQSRYSLLGAMARQLAEAFAARGCPVNPEGAIGDSPALLVYFNFLPDPSTIRPEVTRPGSSVAIVQFLVDHPLALDERQMDRMAALPNFRLFLPCIDAAHTLRLRWPSLVHAHCLHAVPPEALCDEASIAPSHATDRADDQGRPLDVVVTGSIHTEPEIERLRAALPQPLQPAADDIVDLMLAHPHVPFEQALDLCVATANVPTGQWPLAALIWRYATARLNRLRRLAIVRELQGLRVFVYGGEAWGPACTGDTKYQGSVAYEDIPAVLRMAKVSIAWGPTQFTHSFSERLLLSMAAGCATVADDRALVRRHFAPRAAGPAPVALYDPAMPGSARAAVESLLADADARAAAASAARTAVAGAHLWSNRLDLFAAIGSSAIAA